MAFKSNIKLSNSLLWQTDPGTGTNFPVFSPAFSLLNNASSWQFQVNAMREMKGFEIKFVKVEGDIHPFEISAFLEDRRSKEQMFCSRLTASSSSEKIFEGTFSEVYEKLPGLKPYGDMIVVCIFHPSCVLDLKDLPTSLRIRRSLVLEIRKPTIDCPYESPTFSIMETDWKLLINVTQANSSVYKITLQNCREDPPFEPFEVATFIADRRQDKRILCSRLTVSWACEVLYKSFIGSIYEKLPGLRLYDDMMIECTFSSYAEDTLVIKTEKDMKANQGYSQPQIVHGSSQDNVGNHLVLNKYSSKRLYNLESLSEDLGMFLEENVMSDIQLRSGDEVIAAHKFLLAARSKVFLAMLQHEMVESRSGIVDIEDIEPSILRIFLKYLYSGHLPDELSEDTVCKLYATSDKYAVPSLKKLCLCYMDENLNSNNFVKFLMLAASYNDKELQEMVSSFIIDRPELMVDERWVLFSKDFSDTANKIYNLYVTRSVPS